MSLETRASSLESSLGHNSNYPLIHPEFLVLLRTPKLVPTHPFTCKGIPHGLNSLPDCENMNASYHAIGYPNTASQH